MTQSNEIAVREQQPLDFMVPSIFKQALEVAEMYSKAEMIPAHFRNKPYDILIAMETAARLGISALALMQQSFPIGGKLGYLSTFIIAIINTSGKFRGTLKFELTGEGKNRICTAWTIERETDERLEATFSYKTADEEGWVTKSGSKWRTMPDNMLEYRAAASFGRKYCPERLMGMQLKEELEDIGLQPGPDNAIPVDGTIVDSIMTSVSVGDPSEVGSTVVMISEPPKKATKSKKTAHVAEAPIEPEKTNPGANLEVLEPVTEVVYTRADLEDAVNNKMTAEQREEFKADVAMWRSDNPGNHTALHEYLEVFKNWKSKGKI